MLKALRAWEIKAPWVAALLLLAAYLLPSSIFGVPLADSLGYALYVALYIVLPAIVWWSRMGEGGWPGFVLALVIAHAAESLLYVALLAAGFDAAFTAYPLIWLAIGWRALGAWRMPVHVRAWPLLICIALGGLLAAAPILHDFHRAEHHSVWLMAYTNAIANAVPPQDPFFAGQPLLYHYFYNAHVLAAQRFSGADLYQLLRFTAPLAEFALFIAATYAACRVLFGRTWIGMLILVQFLGFFGYGTVAYHWFQTANSSILYRVPSMLPAFSIFVMLLVLVPSYLHHGRRLAIITLLLAALPGFRGNVLPLIICGVAGAMLAQFFATVIGRAPRPEWRRYIVLLLITIAAFVISYFLFFHGHNSGANIMRFAPLNDSASLSWGGKPSDVYGWILALLDSPRIAIVVFVLMLVLFKQLLMLPAVPLALTNGWKLWHARPLFFLACWGAGLMVLLLFENRINEQWAFYIFAHVALSFFLADMVSYLMDRGELKRSAARRSLAFVCCVLLIQSTIFLYHFSRYLIAAPLFTQARAINPGTPWDSFVQAVKETGVRGVIIPYHADPFEEATEKDTRLFAALVPHVSVYHSLVGIQIMKRNGFVPEMQRRVDFVSKPPQCADLAKEAARFRKQGDLLLYSDTPRITMPDACTQRLVEQGKLRMYRFTGTPSSNGYRESTPDASGSQ